jgi:hypothetical protein
MFFNRGGVVSFRQFVRHGRLQGNKEQRQLPATADKLGRPERTRTTAEQSSLPWSFFAGIV